MLLVLAICLFHIEVFPLYRRHIRDMQYGYNTQHNLKNQNRICQYISYQTIFETMFEYLWQAKFAKRRENEKGKFVSISEKIKNIIGVLFTPYVSSTINIFFSIKRKEPVEHLGDGNAQCLQFKLPIKKNVLFKARR